MTLFDPSLMERCRFCGRLAIDAHSAACPLSPDEPLPWLEVPAAVGDDFEAEDWYYDERVGEACS